MYCDYKTKLLYRQHTMSEEGHDVDISVHALSWRHPASMGSVTTRTRITVVSNFIEPDVPNVFASTIEVWREHGWLMLEEYFDDSLQTECYGVLDVERKCLKVLEAFFVGSTDDNEDSAPVKPPQPPPNRRSSIKRKTKAVKPKLVVEETIHEEQLPTSEDDPSFDWI